VTQKVEQMVATKDKWRKQGQRERERERDYVAPHIT